VPLVLDSPAFAPEHAIPAVYTCDGENLSPPLAWHDAPAGTRSFALIVDDPDAPSGTFRHWAIYNVAADATGLAAGVERGPAGQGLGHGVNDFDHARYDGPCPPKGHGVHHYHFRLLALDVERLSLPGDASVVRVADAARGHVLAEAQLIGTYAR